MGKAQGWEIGLTLEALAYPTLVFQPPGFHHTFEACF
jgi:hypothetical protein